MKCVHAVICRHTQTDLNAQNRYSGQINVPLNLEGIRQAENLAEMLAPLNFKEIVCSDLARAVKTAEIIAACHGLTPKQDPRLREVKLGMIDGMSKEEAKRNFPDSKFSTRGEFNFRLLGGEFKIQVIWRQVKAFKEITFTHGSESSPFPIIGIVGHGTSLRVFLEFLGVSCKLEQGGYRIIEYAISEPYNVMATNLIKAIQIQ